MFSSKHVNATLLIAGLSMYYNHSKNWRVSISPKNWIGFLFRKKRRGFAGDISSGGGVRISSGLPIHMYQNTPFYRPES